MKELEDEAAEAEAKGKLLVGPSRKRQRLDSIE